MLTLRANEFKIAGNFRPGELAWDETTNSILLCVTVRSWDSHAFRKLFQRRRDGTWQARYTGPVRFGFNRELSVVYLDPSDPTT